MRVKRMPYVLYCQPACTCDYLSKHTVHIKALLSQKDVCQDYWAFTLPFKASPSEENEKPGFCTID